MDPQQVRDESSQNGLPLGRIRADRSHSPHHRFPIRLLPLEQLKIMCKSRRLALPLEHKPILEPSNRQHPSNAAKRRFDNFDFNISSHGSHSIKIDLPRFKITSWCLPNYLYLAFRDHRDSHLRPRSQRICQHGRYQSCRQHSQSFRLHCVDHRYIDVP